MRQTGSILALTIALCSPALAPAQGANSGLAEPEGNFVTVNGKRLWYRVEGQGPPLILIPGGPGVSHKYLWPYFSVLSNEYRVIYFDAFGRGRSERASIPSEYTFGRDVQDIEALRLALGLGKIAVYGQSYGGLVAQAYALEYPSSLTHLVLGNSFHGAEMWQKGLNDTWNMQLENQMPELWARLQDLRRQGGVSCDSEYQKIESEIPMALPYYYDPTNSEEGNYSSLDVNLDVYCQIAGPDADVVLGGQLASVDFRSRLRKVAVPTLVLAGRFDRISIPRFAVQYRHLMPQAQFVMFEKSGHMPFVEESEKHFDVVRGFLRHR